MSKKTTKWLVYGADIMGAISFIPTILFAIKAHHYSHAITAVCAILWCLACLSKDKFINLLNDKIESIYQELSNKESAETDKE